MEITLTMGLIVSAFVVLGAAILWYPYDKGM
jgi:hypothetical protein